MNAKRFKVIFSKRRNALMVVGENASSTAKSPRTTGGDSVVNRYQKTAGEFIGAISLLFAAISAVYAEPTGGEFAAGAGAISTLGNLTTIQQSSQRAIVNWQSFSSQSNETIKFVQPNANAAILNRVVGNLPSNLNGILEGNGQVYLINQNGIVLGRDGIINVNGGFVASTRDVGDTAFMQGGALVYKGDSIGDIQILGKVKSTQGDVVLIAQKIDVKEGASLIAGEKVQIVAANEVQLTNGKITVKPSLSDAGQITIDGAVQAAQVHLLAHNNNLGALAINTSGNIRATGTQNNPDGSVTIMAEGLGGSIRVTGTIEAFNYDSSQEGGSVIIGRDIETGHLAKSMDASGATLITNKGFIETSGEYLATTGIRVFAKEWLLDPNDIVIGNSATTGGSLAAAQGATGISQILASDISAALTAGTNVVIATSATATGGNGDITVNAAISNTSASNTLTLNAGRNITLNSNITVSNLTLNAETGSINGAANLAISGTTVLNSATTGTLSGIISGGTVTKTGLGTQVLTGNNTFTGGTNINSGTLQIGNGTNNGEIGSGTHHIASGATLNFNVKTGTQALYGKSMTFSGNGNLQKTGAGSIAWGGGAATFEMTGGLINVLAGTLVGSHSANEVWTNNKASLNVASGATFLGVEGNIMVDALTGGGSVSSGYPGYPYGLTVGVNNGSGIFSGTISDANGMVTKLTKVGTGTQILTGANTYTGVTTISAGTLQIGNNGTTGSIGTGAVVNNGTLAFSRTNAIASPYVFSNNISGSGRLLQTATNGGTTKLMGNNTFTGGVVISKGNIMIGNGSASSPDYNRAVGGVNGGTITLGDSNTGSDNVGLYLDKGINASQVSMSRNINVTNNGTGTVTLGGISTATSGGGWTAFNGQITLNKDIIVNDSTGDRTSLDGFITGNGNITLTGNRSIMAGATQNDFVGSFTISSGSTLQMNTGKGLSASNSVINNGFMRVWGGNHITIDALSGSGTISNIVSGTPTIFSVGNGNGSGHFTGVITNGTSAFSVVKNGTGTQTFSGNNSYTGTTTINGGTLQVGSAGTTGTLGTGNVTLNNGANLNYVRAVSTSVANVISGTGNVNATITGASSALTVDKTITLTNGKVNLVTDGNLTVNQAISTTSNATDAIVLVAGKSVAAGTSTGGNVAIGSSGSVTATNGRITFMTGAISSGTSLNVLTGNNRYNSDESTTNYTAALGATGRYAIYREAPTVTAAMKDATKTYDAAGFTGNNGYLTTGLVNGDTSALLSGDTGGSSQGAVNAGTYVISSSGPLLSGLGYKVNPSVASGTLTVNKAELTLTANQNTKTYDAGFASASGVTIVGLQGTTDSVTSLSASYADKNVGTGKLVSIDAGFVVNDGNGGNNYTVSTVSNDTSVITKASLSITTDSESKVYNAATQSLGSAVITGLLEGDSITANQTGGSGKNVGAYTTSTTASGSSITLGNYAITINEGTLDITAKDITVTATADNKTFNGEFQAQVANIVGMESADAADLNVNGLVNERNAGDYTSNISLSGSAANNYTLIKTDATFNIAKANITAVTSDKSVTYNGSAQSLNAADITGVIVGTDVTIDRAGVTRTNVGSTTSMTSLSGDDAMNYTLDSTEGTLTIGKANATVDIHSLSTTYDGTTQESTGFTLSGVFFGDSLNVMGDTVSGRNAGDYNTTATASNSNYNITINQGSLSIAKANLTLTANTETKVYDGTRDSGVAVSVSTLGAGDSVTGLSQSFGSRHVLGADNSTLSVDSGFTINDGNGGNNYNTATLVDATGSITAAAITVSAVTDTKTYDANTTSIGAPIQSDGTLYGTDAITFDGQSFASKNVMGVNGSTLNANTVTVSDGNDGNNYMVTYQSAQGTINKASLSISTDNQSVRYNAETQSLDSAVITGLLEGDSITANQTGGSGKNVGSYVTTTAAAGNATTLGNYEIEITEGTLTIGQKDLLVAAVAGSGLVFNGDTQNQSHTISGFEGDDANLVTVSGLVSERNAGEYTSSITVNGDAVLLANYNIQTTDAEFDIAKASITAITQGRDVTYNAASQSLNPASVSGVINGTDVTINQTGTSRTNVGSTSSVTTISGNDANNYQLTAQEGTLTISAKGLTLNAVAGSGLVFNGSTQNQTFTVTGFEGNDGDNVVVTGLVSERNAGNYTSAIDVSGDVITLGNYIVTKNNAAFDIAKAEITAVTHDMTTTYNALSQQLDGAEISGVIDGTDVAVMQTGMSRVNAGTTTSLTSLEGLDADNYTLSATEGTLTINKAKVIVTGHSSSVVYNGLNNSVDGYEVDGLQGTDTLSSVSASGATGRHAGTYTNTITAGVEDNYTVNTVNGSLVITPKNINVSAQSVIKNYDGNTNAAGTPLTDPLASGNVLANAGIQKFDTALIGKNKRVIAEGVQINDGNGGQNYNINYVDNLNGEIIGSANIDTYVRTIMDIQTLSHGLGFIMLVDEAPTAAGPFDIEGQCDTWAQRLSGRAFVMPTLLRPNQSDISLKLRDLSLVEGHKPQLNSCGVS